MFHLQTQVSVHLALSGGHAEFSVHDGTSVIGLFPGLTELFLANHYSHEFPVEKTLNLGPWQI